MPWGDGIPEFGDHPAGAWGDGVPLGPAEAIAVLLKVTPAIMPNCISVLVGFDGEAKHASSLGANDSLNPNNYSISGASSVSVDAVELVQASPTIVRLSVTATGPDGIVEGVNNYTVSVANVQSITGDALDPASSSASFNGTSCQATGWIAEMFIGLEVVWSSSVSAIEQTLEIDTSKYDGVHELKFKIRGV